VAGLLIALKLEQQRVAVELNEAVVPRRQHADTTLQPGDRLELVTFVGGG
jgi:thiamine biosynthesis protein ThiS